MTTFILRARRQGITIDNALAQRLALEYPLSYVEIRLRIDGAYGNEKLARLALDGHVTVHALLKVMDILLTPTEG